MLIVITVLVISLILLIVSIYKDKINFLSVKLANVEEKINSTLLKRKELLKDSEDVIKEITKTKKEVYKISLSDLLKDEVDMLIQACLFVNPNKNIDDKAINKIEENIKEMNNNPSDYAKSVESKHNFFEGLTKEVLEKAIPNCNITFINAKDNKNIIESYYKLLDKFQPSVLQGKRPDENFII